MAVTGSTCWRAWPSCGGTVVWPPTPPRCCSPAAASSSAAPATRPSAVPVAERQQAVALSELDRRIINALQGDFPLVEEPYAAVAARLGIPEATLLARLQALLEERVLTRFGPLFQVERMGGRFILAALAMPEERFEEVAEQVNALPEVAHNYRRDHPLNMWFVLATETPAGIDAAIDRIEAETGLPVFAFPKERELFVELKLQA